MVASFQMAWGPDGRVRGMRGPYGGPRMAGPYGGPGRGVVRMVILEWRGLDPMPWSGACVAPMAVLAWLGLMAARKVAPDTFPPRMGGSWMVVPPPGWLARAVPDGPRMGGPGYGYGGFLMAGPG